MTEVVGRAKVVVSTEVDPKSTSRVGSLIEGTLKKTALGVGAAVGGILGTAISKGFQRLSSIEEAEAKLKGLGNSAKTVTQVMDDALAAVKGTAFGLGDAAGIAASAIASGVKPGKELERTLKLIADASTIAGTDLSEMGAVFNKVAATGKAQTDVLNQLGDRGIPIVQLLAKELGVTNEKVYEFAKDGKINFETFQAAIEAGMGGAALESGKTFRGALANAGAALGRFGAALLGPSFKEGPDVFARITEKVDEFTPKAAAAGRKVAAFGDSLVKVQKSKEWKSFQSDVKSLGKSVGTLASALGKTVVYFDKLTKKTTGDGLIHWLIELEDKLGPLSTMVRLLESAVEAWKFLSQQQDADPLLTRNYPGSGDLGDLLGANANGTRNWRGGWSVVGEQGPEIVNLPKGADVYSNRESRSMMGGDTYNNTNIYNGPESSAKGRRDADWWAKHGTRFGAATTAGVPV